MNTIGTVVWVDKTRGMFKVRCENGRTALVEIQDYIDIELQDTISGDLMNTSEETVSLYSADHNENFEALIQNLE